MPCHVKTRFGCQAFEALQQHSRLELQHLDQAGTKIASCVANLLSIWDQRIVYSGGKLGKWCNVLGNLWHLGSVFKAAFGRPRRSWTYNFNVTFLASNGGLGSAPCKLWRVRHLLEAQHSHHIPYCSGSTFQIFPPWWTILAVTHCIIHSLEVRAKT